MASSDLNVVTGASGFSGRYITRRLLGQGQRVVNLTGHPDRRSEWGSQVESAFLNFEDLEALTTSLTGAATLYNTYWIRFSHSDMTFDKAIQNTQTLIRAARNAGVQRIVHISITNPSLDSPLPYFKGKAIVEQAIADSGLSYAILRPAIIFGDNGILINNIAWFLRRMPAFAVPGSGAYRLQPIYVDDLAQLALEAGQSQDNTIIDATGPEAPSFNELLRWIADAVHSSTYIVHLPPALVLDHDRHHRSPAERRGPYPG